MASSASATVVQANLTGSELLFTDTGTYGTIISRTLNIYDCNGNLLQTVSLGNTRTYLYTITFYTASYLNAFTGNVPLPINNCNLDRAENFLNASLRFNVGGNFVAAQANIVWANYFVNLEQ